MLDLPRVSKGITTGLAKFERVRNVVLGVALAVGLATAGAEATPTAPVVAPTQHAVTAQDHGAMLLAAPAGTSTSQTIAQHESHYSHYSHASHQSHYSHYSSRY